jgi:hypothetical protein
MVEMVLFANDRFRNVMTEELRRTKLGPFTEEKEFPAETAAVA